MSETKIYKEIDGSHTFVKSIITEYYDFIPEEDKENFNNIRVYNTIKDPLFSGPDVYYCLKKTKKHVDRMYADLLDDEVLRNQLVDGKSNNMNLITEYGVIHACYLYKNTIAITFQKFMREIIKQLKEKGVATMVEAHTELKIKYESARDRYQEAEHLNKRNIQIQEAFINPDDTDVQNHTELTILRRENMKQYYVYLADWKYVNTRYWKTFPQKDKKPTTNAVKKLEPPSDSKYDGIDLNGSDSDTDDSSKIIDIKKKIIFDESDPHPDGLQEEYDLYNTDLRDIKNNENDDYYIYISTKEVHQSKKHHFKFLRFIYVKDTKHYKEMMDYIANGKKYNNDTSYTVNNDLPEIEYIPYSVETAYKGVYQLNYSNLIDARNSSFINLHKSTLDLHKSEKRNKRK
jgi:hypothetical protein